MRDLFGLAVATLLVVGPGAAGAQQCDDGLQCTVNDMCREGECTGTPMVSGGCNDYNDCTVNDRCGVDGFCTGDPAPLNTRCGGGCGTCQPLSPFPIPGMPLQCVGDPANSGDSCDASFYGPCFQGSCEMFDTGLGSSFAYCIPRLVECPATGDCKGACNPETGRCDNNISLCYPGCERCDRGQCVPANQGKACEDFDPCTSQSKCGTAPFDASRGFCVPGEPSGDVPTPTPAGQVPTPTVPPAGGCVGDCNDNGEVAINELIIGVNIALGSAQLTQCPSFDRNANGEVEVNELIQGVNAALGSCDG